MKGTYGKCVRIFRRIFFLIRFSTSFFPTVRHGGGGGGARFSPLQVHN